MRSGHALELDREVRADASGIRTLVRCGGALIKFEIVYEARIALDAASTSRVCGLSTLAPLDQVTRKLVANSDRWADHSAMSRDVIDVAMMRPDIRLLRRAIVKAEGAYGDAVRRDLSKAIDALTGDPARVAACVAAMRMNDMPPAVLVQRLRELRARLKKA